MPLHDHPHMAVLSRILCGSVHVKTFDYNDEKKKRKKQPLKKTTSNKKDDDDDDDNDGNEENSLNRDKTKIVICQRDEILYSNSTLHLFEDRENIHTFQAGAEGAAILDIIIPQYNDEEGRICTYYNLIPLQEQESEEKYTYTYQKDTNRIQRTKEEEE